MVLYQAVHHPAVVQEKPNLLGKITEVALCAVSAVRCYHHARTLSACGCKVEVRACGAAEVFRSWCCTKPYITP